MHWILVALGGSLGALARYAISLYFLGKTSGNTAFPVATFIANLLGAFVIGVLYVIIVDKALIAPYWRQAAMVGFLGAFTTFSTFALESLQLLQTNQWILAALYAIGSLVGGLLCVACGIHMTSKLLL